MAASIMETQLSPDPSRTATNRTGPTTVPCATPTDVGRGSLVDQTALVEPKHGWSLATGVNRTRGGVTTEQAIQTDITTDIA